MIKSWNYILATMLLCFGFQTNACAEGFYFGGGVYENEIDDRQFDDDDTTEAFFLGYNIIDSNFFLFSAELGYHDLGEYESGGFEAEADAVSLAAVAGIPVGPFIEIYAKAGFADVSLEVNDKDFDGSENFLGAGVSLDFFDTVDIYVEYLEFDTDADIESVGVGIKFDFF